MDSVGNDIDIDMGQGEIGRGEKVVCICGRARRRDMLLLSEGDNGSGKWPGKEERAVS